jgi:hypothetical protein
MQPWRCRVELNYEYKHGKRDGLSTTGFEIKEEYCFFKSGTALSTLICMVSLFSTQIKSSHDFELKKTREFLDEVGPLFGTCMVLSSIVSFSSLFNLFHIHLFHPSERRHPLMPVCFTIPLQCILH